MSDRGFEGNEWLMGEWFPRYIDGVELMPGPSIPPTLTPADMQRENGIYVAHIERMNTEHIRIPIGWCIAIVLFGYALGIVMGALCFR